MSTRPPKAIASIVAFRSRADKRVAILLESRSQ